MVGEEKKVKYVSVIPKAEGPDTKFQTFNEEKGKYDFHADFKLIRSIDELREYAKKCEGNRIAVDTETTGLSYDTDFIVGFSVSLSDYDGIYVPIRHQTRTTVKEKVAKVDENGNPVLTKTGKQSMHTIERHTDRDWAGNLPAKEALDILFYDIMCKAKMNLLHNSGFDLNMLRKEGYDVIKARTFDTMVLSYIYDPEARMNGLKPLADWVLGRKMTHFDEVTGGDNLFRFTNPEESYEYACSDSACTFGLYKALYKPVLELLKKAPEHMIIDGKPYNIMVEDNNLIRAFVDYYDHCELKIDKNVALAYKDLIDKQTAEVVEKIYSYFGKGIFSLSTGSKEFKTTMAEFNFETGARTKKGAVAYGKEGIKTMQRALNGFKNNIYPLITKIFFLESKLIFAGKDAGDDTAVRNAAYELAKFIFNYGRPYFKIGKLGESSTALALRDLNNKKLNKEEFVNMLNLMYEKEREKLNILQLVQNYTTLQKALNSYVSKLTEADSCRMKYRLTGTKSSRLSSGNGAKNSKAKNTYFSDLSAQTLSKPKSQWYEGRPATPEEMDKSVLGWVFTPVSNEYYQQYSHEKVIVEGFKQEANVRSCIVAPEGRYIVSMDYGAEEIYVLAFLCQDSKQMSALRAKVDFHKQTALALFGEENYNVQARKKAKGCVGDNVLISTTRGLIPAGQLEPDDLLIGVDGKPQKYAKITETNKLLKIRWSNGIESEFTPNHPVQVWDGSKIRWKAACTLTPDDEVVSYVGYYDVSTGPKIEDYSDKVLVRSNKHINKVFNINTPEFAYIAGLYLGDGSTYGEIKEVSFCANNEVLPYLLHCFNVLNISYSKPLPVGKNKGTNVVRVHNTALARIINKYFGSCKNKGINKDLFQVWGKNELKHFLAGLVDSDGSVAFGGYLSISSTVPTIISTITYCANALGIKCMLNDKIATCNGKKFNYSEITLYDLGNVDLPIRYSKRTPTNAGMSRRGNWSISEELRADIKKNVVYKDGIGTDKAKFNYTIENISGGHTTFNRNVLSILEDNGYPQEIKQNMQKVKLVSVEEVTGNVNIIETENHTYIADFIGSHNCNFLMNYGGGPGTLSENLDISFEEAKDIIDKYQRTFHECMRWKRKEAEKMYNNQGLIYTRFGRPRQLKPWLDEARRLGDNGLNGYCERSVVSHDIQGFCGDICRFDMNKFYKQIRCNPEHRDHVDFLSFIHDELNTTVDKEHIEKYVRILQDIMVFPYLDKELPLETGIEIGYRLGDIYPFTWNDPSTRDYLVPERSYFGD